MHTRGRSSTMYAEAVYEDVVADVVKELRVSVQCALDAGVPIERLIVDPGVGFAKRPLHSYGVLARLPEFAAALDRPVLVGPSRKSFLRDAVGGRPAAERDWGTAAAVTAAVLAARTSCACMRWPRCRRWSGCRGNPALWLMLECGRV